MWIIPILNDTKIIDIDDKKCMKIDDESMIKLMRHSYIDHNIIHHKKDNY